LDESAGKRKSTRTRKARVLAQNGARPGRLGSRPAKDSYYRAQFHRLRARRGPKKAIVAVAASILTAIYYVLRDGVEYRELGGQYFQRLDPSRRPTDWSSAYRTSAIACS
jgi:hypothetical protein